MQNSPDDDARHPATQHVDGVMGLYVDGGKAHQDEEWNRTPEEQFIAAAPGQYHQDGGHADVTAWEGRCGTFAGIVGTHHALVEEAVCIAGYGQALLVGREVMAEVGEYTAGDIVNTCCQIIILRSCDGQQDEDDVINEERCEDDKRGAVKLPRTAEEVEQGGSGYQRVIRGIA